MYVPVIKIIKTSYVGAVRLISFNNKDRQKNLTPMLIMRKIGKKVERILKKQYN